MPRHAILFLGIVLCCTAAAAQIVVAPHEAAPTFNPETKKALPSSAELALDAAKRWTQAALDDSSNLQPIEGDFLQVRVAKAWNGVDHAKAEGYLKDAMEHLEIDTSQKSTPRNANASEAISQISSDVMAVDRDAWNRLIELLSPSDVSDAIAAEAQTLAEREDPKGAMELERKSLAHGGSSSDLETLHSLIGTDQNSASQLFDEILKTASNPGSNPDLLSEMLHRLNGGDDAFSRFLTQERRQRLAELVGQRTLADTNEGEDACNYSFAAAPLMSQYSPAMQGQFRAIVDDCNRKGAYGQIEADGRKLNNTDDLVQAMNDASDAKIKADLRWRAATHAAYVDGDYERAIQLCLDASPQERVGAAFPFDRFENHASNLAWQALSTALRKHDDLEAQRVLAFLTPGLKAHAEINAIRLLAPKDKVQSLLMLSDARNILEHEVPPHTTTYFFMLSETTQLAPEDINLSWRVLGNGLNRFAQQMKTAQSHGGITQSAAYVNPIYPWFMPEKALTDEGLVRAIVGDLTSPEFRACLRLTVIQEFLMRYTDAIRELQSKPGNSIKTAKN